MSEPNDNSANEAGVDIFGSRQGSAQSGVTADGVTDQQTLEAAPAPSAQSRPAVRPVHFAGAAVLVAAAWIGWPYMSGRAAGSDVQGSPARMLVPIQSPSAPHAGEDPHAVAKAPAPSGVAQGGADTPAATPAPTVSNVALVAPAAAPGVTLQAKVDELQAKLEQAQAHAAACPAAPTVASSTPQTHRRARPARHVVRVVNGERREQGPLVREFTLNTIYRGQAWIQSEERTYVVQAGDVVDGLRIERVEPRARQVVTSRGVIR